MTTPPVMPTGKKEGPQSQPKSVGDFRTKLRCEPPRVRRWVAGALLQAGRGVFRADPRRAVEPLVMRTHLVNLLLLA